MSQVIKKTYNITNMIGEVGEMENGVHCTTSEKAYLKTSSLHKYGSGSKAFQQSNSATELTYTLHDINGEISFNLNNTHKYYFSIWIMQRTSLDITFDAYWPIGEPSIMNGITNTKLNEWEQKSVVFERTGFSNGSYTFRIDCNNYPGSNAVMNIDGLMLVDLTETFGSGNEPDKDWCDSNIAFTTSTTTAEWWEITKDIEMQYYNGSKKKYEILYPKVNLTNTVGILSIKNGGTGADNNETALINLGAAKLYHKHPASDITEGVFNSTSIKAKNGTDYSMARIRNIQAGTTDLTVGTSSLSSGDIYLVYEE